MKVTLENFGKRRAFTIVELITTITVIAILVGLLIPALSVVRSTAAMVKQKSQFSTIEIGLEAFKADFGVYPESKTTTGTNGDKYYGAQKLAEAMVGMDGLGFHPDSQWRADRKAGTPPNEIDLYEFPTKDERQGRYIEIDTAKATAPKDIYSNAATFFPGETLVLADTFKKVTHLTSGKQTGMPILYYRADTTKAFHLQIYSIGAESSLTNPGSNDIFFQSDLAGPGVPFAPSLRHPAGLDPFKFYNLIRNDDLPSTEFLPYRADSFILHSAGPDGLYGNNDDVFNFDRGH